MGNLDRELTFDFPSASGAPAGADSHEVHRERFRVGPGDERNCLPLATGRHDAAVPTHPETTEFASVEDAGCFDFNLVWFGSVPPDYALGVAPTTDDNLEKKSCHKSALFETTTNIITT